MRIEMVEIEGNEGEKGRFASLKKGQLIESITLEEALELFALPRDLGELEGEQLSVGIGKYGPYVRHGKSFASLQKGDDLGIWGRPEKHFCQHTKTIR